MSFNLVNPRTAETLYCPVSLANQGEEKCCIGPGCMAWRWNAEGEAGYCGMAGIPSTPAESLKDMLPLLPGMIRSVMP